MRKTGSISRAMTTQTKTHNTPENGERLKGLKTGRAQGSVGPSRGGTRLGHTVGDQHPLRVQACATQNQSL